MTFKTITKLFGNKDLIKIIGVIKWRAIKFIQKMWRVVKFSGGKI